MLVALWLMRNVPGSFGSLLPWWHDLPETDISKRIANNEPRSPSHDEAQPRLRSNAWIKHGVMFHRAGRRLAQNSKHSMVKALHSWRSIRFFTARWNWQLLMTN